MKARLADLLNKNPNFHELSEPSSEAAKAFSFLQSQEKPIPLIETLPTATPDENSATTSRTANSAQKKHPPYQVTQWLSFLTNNKGATVAWIDPEEPRAGFQIFLKGQNFPIHTVTRGAIFQHSKSNPTEKKQANSATVWMVPNPIQSAYRVKAQIRPKYAPK